eukprot:g58693.t1
MSWLWILVHSSRGQRVCEILNPWIRLQTETRLLSDISELAKVPPGPTSKNKAEELHRSSLAIYFRKNTTGRSYYPGPPSKRDNVISPQYKP